jgi:hypothetical protein
MAERVPWQDLVRLSPRETAAELLLPLPWLLLAIALAASMFPFLALIAIAPFFTSALRVTHDTYHRNLGLSPREGDLLLFALSLLLGGALHAIEYTHLRHHRDCLGHTDLEGRIAHYGFWPALARSPLYPILIHIETWQHGSARQRRWLRRELVAVVVVQTWIWCGDCTVLQWLSASLLLANAIVPMIGIWSVHRSCADDARKARSTRRSWLLRLSFGMLYHDEHHAYPAVPARHLPRLAQRLDRRGIAVAHDVIGHASISRHGLANTLCIAAFAVAGCAPRSAGQTQLDVCTLLDEPVRAFIATPRLVAEPTEGSLAGTCLVRAASDAQNAAQITVHVHTAAAARAHEASLDRTWRLLLAEARNSFGAQGQPLDLRRTKETAAFGFERNGSGQILIAGRGLVVELGSRGLSREQADRLTERFWQALLHAH